MPEWQQIKQHLAQSFRLVEDSGQVLTIEVPLERGRAQFVFVQIVEGMPLLVLGSIIGTFEDVDPQTLLRLSAERFLGVRVGPGGFIVTSVVPTSDMDANELEFAVLLVAGEADAYEEALRLGDRR